MSIDFFNLIPADNSNYFRTNLYYTYIIITWFLNIFSCDFFDFQNSVIWRKNLSFGGNGNRLTSKSKRAQHCVNCLFRQCRMIHIIDRPTRVPPPIRIGLFRGMRQVTKKNNKTNRYIFFVKLNGNNSSISNYPESLIPAGVDCNPSKTCFLTPKLFIGFGLELEAEAGTNVEDIPELLGRKLCCDLT